MLLATIIACLPLLQGVGDETAPASSGTAARERAPLDPPPASRQVSLIQGVRIDLLAGEVVTEGGHIQVSYVSQTTAGLQPRDGNLLAHIASSSEWSVPLHLEDTQRRSKVYSTGSRSLRPGHELAVHLVQEGIYGRLWVIDVGDGQLELVCQLDPAGGTVLPRAPRLSSMEWRAGALVVEFRKAPREATSVSSSAEHDRLTIVAERELNFGAGDWVEHEVGGGGERTLTLDFDGTSRVARYRFRHRFGSGLESPECEPVEVLHADPTDEAQREVWIAEAVRDLTSSEYQARLDARAVLGAYGKHAWIDLREALKSTDPELARAARELLLSEGSSSEGHVAAVLEATAFLEGMDHVPAPEGWLEDSPTARASAMLGSYGLARDDVERGHQEAWLRVLERADPEPAVQHLAEVLTRRPWAERTSLRGGPMALAPPESRDASQVLYAQPRAALVHLLVRQAELRDPEFLGSDAAVDALRLVEHYLSGGERVLLEAACSLVPDRGALLLALEELSAQRSRGLDVASLERERFELNAPTLEELRGALEGLATSHTTYVDLVLPVGTYSGSDTESVILDIGIDGLRLIGAPGVVLQCGLRVHGATDVVVEELEVAYERGQALNVMDGDVLLRDVKLAGMDYAAFVHDGRLELDRVHLAPSVVGRPSSSCLRTQGEVTVTARGSRFEGGALMPGEGALMYLERCVVDAGERNIVQGQRGGRLVARDTLFRSTTGGMFGLAEVVLEGVVIDVPKQPFGAGIELALCAEHVVLAGGSSGSDLTGAWMDLCALRHK